MCIQITFPRIVKTKQATESVHAMQACGVFVSFGMLSMRHTHTCVTVYASVFSGV